MARPRNTPDGTTTDTDATGSGPVKATVLLDTYSWYEKFGDTSSTVNIASRGDRINVSQQEMDRGRSMTPAGLAPASDEDPTFADQPVEIPKDLADVSDADLLALASRLGARVDSDTPRDVLVAAVVAAPGNFERPQQ